MPIVTIFQKLGDEFTRTQLLEEQLPWELEIQPSLG